MREVQNKSNHISGANSSVGMGPSTSNHGTETFLYGSANVDFDIGLEFDGQLLQFY